jgi:hypothetical protein
LGARRKCDEKTTLQNDSTTWEKLEEKEHNREGDIMLKGGKQKSYQKSRRWTIEKGKEAKLKPQQFG